MTAVETICGMVLPVAPDELVRDVVRRHRAGCDTCRISATIYGAVLEVRTS